MTSSLLALGGQSRAKYGQVGLMDAAGPGQGVDRTFRRIAGTFATKILTLSLSVPVSVVLARALFAP